MRSAPGGVYRGHAPALATVHAAPPEAVDAKAGDQVDRDAQAHLAVSVLLLSTVVATQA
jgi:hypothetical protein